MGTSQSHARGSDKGLSPDHGAAKRAWNLSSPPFDRIPDAEHTMDVKPTFTPTTSTTHMFGGNPSALHLNFLECPKPTLYGLFNMTGSWYLCRVQKYDARTGSVIIVWEDGSTHTIAKPYVGKSLQRILHQRSVAIERTMMKEEQMQQQQRDAPVSGVSSTLHHIRISKHLLARPTFRSVRRTSANPSQDITIEDGELSAVFFACEAPTLYGRYKNTGQWYLCRIRSLDHDGTYTVAWEDGSIQCGTTNDDLRRLAADPAAWIEEALVKEVVLVKQLHAKRKKKQQSWLKGWGKGNGKAANPNQSRKDDFSVASAAVSIGQAEDDRMARTPEKGSSNENRKKDEHANAVDSHYDHNHGDNDDEMDVWEAAKRGDMEVCLAIIDRGDATPNDVEMLSSGKDMFGTTPHNYTVGIAPSDGMANNANQPATEGRSPLYWACFGGHAELVPQRAGPKCLAMFGDVWR